MWKFCPGCGASLREEKTLLFFERFFRSRRNRFLFVLVNIGVIGFFAYLAIHSRDDLARKNQEMQALIEERQTVKVSADYVSEIFPLTYWGDRERMATLRIDSPSYGKIRVVSSIEGITREKSEIVDVRPGGSVLYVGPDIESFGFAWLRESRKTVMHVSVFQEQGDTGQETKVFGGDSDVLVHNRSDIVWNDGTDNSRFAVRLIDKDRPEIAEMVRAASDHMKELGGSTNALIGSAGDKAEIRRGVQALFLAMSKDEKVRYVYAPFSYDNVQIQHVKLPEEVLATKSGLCIELTLLMAAAMEHVGLRPVLVLTDGHAWVGAETGPRSKDYVFIETTALDKTPQEAMDIGEQNWKTINDGGLPYVLVNVNELRADKLLPIRYE